MRRFIFPNRFLI